MSHEAIVTVILASLVVIAFGLFWWLGSYSDRIFAKRFRTRFPEKSLSYTAGQLGELVQSDLRIKYVFPILFPLDFIVMLALAGSMGAASSHWINQLHPPAAWLGLVVQHSSPKTFSSHKPPKVLMFTFCVTFYTIGTTLWPARF